MTIAYRSSTTAGGGTGTSVTLTKPAGTVDNDILIAVLYREIASGWTPPAGWTQLCDLTSADGGSSEYLTVYWKRAASEGASYVWSVASTWVIGAMTAFSGCTLSGSPVDAGATNYCSGDVAAHTPIGASITTTVANAMRFVAVINVSGNDVTVGTSGMTQGPQLNGTELWYSIQAAAGASGTMTFGAVTDYSHWVTYHADLIPDTSPPATQALASVFFGDFPKMILQNNPGGY